MTYEVNLYVQCRIILISKGFTNEFRRVACWLPRSRACLMRHTQNAAHALRCRYLVQSAACYNRRWAVQSSADVVCLVMVATSRCRRRVGRVFSRESGCFSPKQTEAYISGNKLHGPSVTPTRRGTARSHCQIQTKINNAGLKSGLRHNAFSSM